ncbi:DUF4956 domain-containing protein [Luedemannella flava]
MAYLGVNVGVLAVSSSLASETVGAGLGLGLFGVLSIIRLRSTEIDQREVAYYFSALALGILGPLSPRLWLGVSLMALVLVVMYVADHPRLFRSYKRQVLVLDTAIVDHDELVAHLERLLGARVHAANVERLDAVNDTTIVEVRYSHQRVGAGRSTHAAEGPAWNAYSPAPASHDAARAGLGGHR